MPEFPQWINELFSNEPVEQRSAEDAVVDESNRRESIGINDVSDLNLLHFNEDAIKTFIFQHFAEPEGEGERSTYHFKPTDIHLNREKMQALIKVMKDYHYDGEMHKTDCKPSTESSAQQWLNSFTTALKQNLLSPSALMFQLLNLLEVTAVLSAIWEKDPSYEPNLAMYLGLSVVGAAALRSNHFYASAIGGWSHEDIANCRAKINEATTVLKTALNRVIDDENKRDTLLRLLTRPALGYRFEQEVRSWLSYFVKASASIAVFFALFREQLEKGTISWTAVAMMGFFAGSVEGIDMAFNNVLAISGEHQALLRFQRAVIPPVKTEDLAFFFDKVANFSPIPWMMAKVGPALWAVVKARAAFTLMQLFDLKSDEMRGGLYGVYGVAALSALYVSHVFSVYNVDKKLGQELSTIRDFLYTHTHDFSSVGKALTGALPMAALAAFIGHACGLGYVPAGLGCGLPVELITAGAIWYSEKFADWYRYFVEVRFMGSAVQKLDAMHMTDKTLFVLSGLAMSAFGIIKNHAVVVGAGEVLLFVMVTAFMAECSRHAASVVRYATVQMALYAAALITWILNCLLPLNNLLHNRNPKDRPHVLSEDYFHMAGYVILLVGSLAAGFAAGIKDHNATAKKVDVLVDKIPDEDRSAGAALRVIDAVKTCAWDCGSAFFNAIRNRWGSDAEKQNFTDASSLSGGKYGAA